MQISIKTNFAGIQRKLDTLGKQAPFATAVAMTRTVQEARVDLQKEMRRVFDRPTRYTLNSLYIKPATKTRLQASVFIKDSERPKHYLWPEIEGGARPQKRFEELLRQRGLIGSTERLVPGAGAKLDASGNMNRGQIVQILSQLQAFRLAGSDANATNSRRSVKKRATVNYFFARQRDTRAGKGSWKNGEKAQHLPTGVYAKTSDGSIIPVLVVVKRANYSARLRFNEIGHRTISRRFPYHFAIEFHKAMAASGWSR